MKATTSWAAAVVAALVLVSTASAQYSPVTGQYHAPVSRAPLGYAPNTYGPGFYVLCPNGQIIGPNYCLRPSFEPFQGIRPTVYKVDGKLAVAPQVAPQQQPEAQYPYHPWARSPRDFFMFRENMEEQNSRQSRPTVLP